MSEEAQAVTPEVEQVAEAPKEQESAQKVNFKQLRQKAEAAERAAQRLAQENEILRQQFTSIAAAKQSQPEQRFTIEDNEVIDGKTFNRGLQTYEERIKREAKEEARREFEELYEQKENQKIPQRLRRDYPDFDSVVNEETIEWLNENKPLVAAKLRDLAKDPYGQQATAYEFIKALHPTKNKVAGFEKEKIAAAKNLNSPKSGEVFGGQSALHEIGGVLDFSREGLIAKQNALIRQAGYGN